MKAPDRFADVWPLIQHSQDIIITVEDDGTITFVNQAVESTLGYEPETLVGTNAFDLIHVDDREKLRERFTTLIERPGRATDRVQHRMLHADGTVRWVESIGSNQRDTNLDGYVINSRDITETKVQARALEEYKEYNEAILDSFEDGFFVMDSEAGIRRWNRTVTEETGYTDEEVASMNAADFVPDEQSDVIAENLREALETGGARFEADLVGKDGRRTSYEFVASRLEDPEGETVIAGLGRDVTERNEREQELRRFRKAIHASGHAIYITDADSHIEYVNPAFEEITGFSEEEVLGATPRILQSGEMPPEYYEALWASLLDGQVWEEEIVNRRKDGGLYNARQTIAPIRDSSGDLDGFVAIQSDVTDEKARVEQLETAELAIESAEELIAGVDDEYTYLFANEQYRQSHGVSLEEIRHSSPAEVIGDDTWREVKPLVDEALGGDPVRYQITRPSPEGLERTFDIHYYPIRERTSNGIRGVVGTMWDITELKERTQHLAVLGRVLRHNLHNQMNIIHGRAEMISEEADADIKRYADVILSESDRLLDTVDKTRDISKLFADDDTRQVIDVQAMVSSLVDTFRDEHPTSTIESTIQCSVSVLASDKLELAISELLRNAIIHNDQEHPNIEISSTLSGDRVAIQVRDNGPGIPEMEREVLTSDRLEEPLYHGSGLGLWLVYWIVRRSNGTIAFRENRPTGSVVELSLPRKRGQATSAI